MDLEQIKTRAAEIADRLAELDGVTDWSEEQRAEFDTLLSETRDLEARRKDIEARAHVRQLATDLRNVEVPEAPQVRVTQDPYDLSTLRFGASATELRGRALTAVEQTDYIEDTAKAAVVRKIERVKDPRGVIAGLVLHTGNDAYQRAFHKGLAGAQAMWTTDEREAMERAQLFRAAMSLTDSAGGYAIPFTLDPSLIMTSDGSVNPFRRIARIETITTDTWNGVSTAGVTASFDAELAEVSDDSPTFAQPSITTRMARAFVQGSIEISMDYRNLAGDLAELFREAKDDLEATVFVDGASGSNQPIGITTALDGTASEIAPTTAETFAAADLYKTLNALPARHRGPAARVAWTAALGTINDIRAFAEGNYDLRLTTLADGQPERLLGYPLYEASAMDSSADISTTGPTADHFVLVLGDWRNYVIADRVGLSVEFIPHLFHTSNNLPKGARGWFAFWRVGADSVNDNGFAMLSIPTTT